jgi:Tol biopolymer transport system component
MAQVPTTTDAEDDAAAAKAGRIAEEFEVSALVLTVFDRQGNVVTTVGERAIYRNAVFSPDRKRLAVIKSDLNSETVDLWVFDIATGASTDITSNKMRDHEWVSTPVWSPDGSQLAYVALREGYEGLYRKASNGEGPEELLYRYSGAFMDLMDWSMDGRFLSFSATDLSGGTLYALPLSGNGERTPIEVFRSESQLWGSSFSLDNRFLSYESDQSGRNEVYVRPFDPSADAASAAGPWQVSDQGGRAIYSSWRRDGREFYYVAADGGVMAVEVSTGPAFEFGEPTLLFRLSEAVPVIPRTANVSRDGERVVIAVPHAPTLQQITVFDRQGTVLTQVGELGRYNNPSPSPDGTKVAVERIVPQTGSRDIWTFDVDSGVGTPVISDNFLQETPLWSPDGNYLAYASMHGFFDVIYRKAWNGTGDEDQWFQYTPGADMELTDWSADGRFIAFHDGCHGVLYVVPVGGDEEALEREAMEWLRDEYSVAQARFSPDSRFIAYLSDEILVDIFQVYVGPFDASEPDGGRGGATPVQVSHAGALGMISWRQDGKELYYMTPDWEVMAVDVTTTPTFQAGTPRLLFTLPGPLPGGPAHWSNVSPDGQRFVFVIDVTVSVLAP